jgi:hypothetical protein
VARRDRPGCRLAWSLGRGLGPARSPWLPQAQAGQMHGYAASGGSPAPITARGFYRFPGAPSSAPGAIPGLCGVGYARNNRRSSIAADSSRAHVAHLGRRDLQHANHRLLAVAIGVNPAAEAYASRARRIAEPHRCSKCRLPPGADDSLPRVWGQPAAQPWSGDRVAGSG